MSRSRISIALVVLFACILLWADGPSGASAAGPLRTAKVRLYSGGQVVGEWEAVAAGRMEGDAFVFPVRSGVQELEVRIRGSFSYEVQP